jgi:hypothetical protein
VDDAEVVRENALKANPKDDAEQYERQLSELKEAYREAKLEVNLQRKLQSHFPSTEDSKPDSLTRWRRKVHQHS